MKEKYQQFYSQVNGKYIEVEDSSNYAQCMDLAFKWCDFLEIPRDTIRHLYAYQVWINPFDSTHKYFDLIPNGPTNIPSVGSLVVFGQKVGSAGHISIADPDSNKTNLTSLDQNWSIPRYTRTVVHPYYSGVLGWLTPKITTPNYDDLNQQIKNIVNGGATAKDKFTQVKTLVNKN